MVKNLKKGLFILSTISLIALNNNIVKADELPEITGLSEVTDYASLSSVIEKDEGEVLGTMNVAETDDGLILISSETGEELVVGENLTITKSEYEDLCKIVQAEAGNQDEKGKILVANVILNRVNNPKFDNNIHDVIFASGQFSPVRNGSFNKAVPTDETKEAINKVLDGEDYSEGALYFRATSSNGNWGKHKILFAHGGHKFYK